jgi:formylglycine-generating enzyme required for sulfatase activity
MKSIHIHNYSLNFHPAPKGQVHYQVNWDKKPHRNQFIKRGVTTVDIDIVHDVWISETLITQEIWTEIMGKNPSKFKGVHKPIENISYNDIIEFLSRLNALTSHKFRLLKESEFIYACTLNYDNNFQSKLNDIVWFGENSKGQTQSVLSKPLGKLKISDLLGNVYHFVENDITQVPSDKCVYMGACWATQALWVDKDYVMKIDKNGKDNTIGFRIVLT